MMHLVLILSRCVSYKVSINKTPSRALRDATPGTRERDAVQLEMANSLADDAIPWRTRRQFVIDHSANQMPCFESLTYRLRLRDTRARLSSGYSC